MIEKYEKDPGVLLYKTNREYYKKQLDTMSEKKWRMIDWYIDTPDAVFSDGIAIFGNHYSWIAKVFQEFARTMNMLREGNLPPTGKRASKRQLVTQEYFDRIKALLYQGEEYNEIYKQTWVKRTTYRYIVRAQSLEEFHQLRRDDTLKYITRNNENRELPENTIVTFRGTLPGPPAPHRQALADAIDAFIKEEVKIRLQMELDKIKESLGS